MLMMGMEGWTELPFERWGEEIEMKETKEGRKKEGQQQLEGPRPPSFLRPPPPTIQGEHEDLQIPLLHQQSDRPLSLSFAELLPVRDPRESPVAVDHHRSQSVELEHSSCYSSLSMFDLDLRSLPCCVRGGVRRRWKSEDRSLGSFFLVS